MEEACANFSEGDAVFFKLLWLVNDEVLEIDGPRHGD